MDIKDKCALVTGGASGIGFSCASELLRHGAKCVIIIDQNNVAGLEAKEKLKNFGDKRTVFFPCDLTNKEQFSDVFRKANEICKGLDIVVNNAGICDEQHWDLMIDINFKALVRGTLLTLDCMGKHKGGKGGTVVNVASIAGLTTLGSLPVYSGTKYAVFGFSKGIEIFYNSTGVRVLTLCPGVTKTNLVEEMNDKLLDFVDVEATKKRLGSLPLQETSAVAAAMMKMITTAKNGATWVIEGDKPPYEVQIPHYSTLKV
ncbi:15-hydroxyprostaglandin dehydrogenase [NAD(+)]-like [Leptopilina heterotoma]|uniref:15-hydroxyprostaglandin dehydrogenase [NAD(+)]-like n=1 Tax=Leptopilina heterotoma TaxID=63436 RepID=UPI001CA84C94|nr:15-hydroxyprostaglandin dehydrogenase [NAD(+)]-like [Leptopilina heterotoma]